MTRTETCHKHDGTPQGAFALFVSRCRGLLPAITDGGLAVDSLDQEVFHSVEYHNYSDDRTLPLLRCHLLDSMIRGMFLHLTWLDVACTKLDMAHTAGTATWQKVVLRRCNVDRFHTLKLRAVDCVFERTRFRESVLEDCTFERCTFTRCDLRDCRFLGASFVDCHFNDVDLSGVLWSQSKIIQIAGTWRGTPIPLPVG